MITYKVNASESNQTLEKYVKKILPMAPLSFLYKLFRKKDVKVNNHWEDRKFIISVDDEIKIYVTDAQLEEFKNKRTINASNDIENWIVYEDKNILIINKPKGVLVQKAKDTDFSLTEMVLSYLSYTGEYDPNNGSSFTPGPAHRIDRNTSGLVVFGKSIRALQVLFDLFKEKEAISKHYITLVKGEVTKDGEVNLPIFKDEKNNKVYISEKGKKAVTKYHVLKAFNGYTLLEVIILTGRTHQIRIHMSAINHPVIGDSKYGDFELNREFENKFGLKSQFLHASRLDFGDLDSPLDNISRKHFETSLPKELNDIIDNL